MVSLLQRGFPDINTHAPNNLGASHGTCHHWKLASLFVCFSRLFSRKGKLHQRWHCTWCASYHTLSTWQSLVLAHTISIPQMNECNRVADTKVGWSGGQVQLSRRPMSTLEEALGSSSRQTLFSWTPATLSLGLSWRSVLRAWLLPDG